MNDDDLWLAIRDHIDACGYPPTIRDLQAALEISSTSVVEYHLKALERQGRIRREPGVARSIRVVR